MSVNTVREDLSILQNLTFISDKAIRVRNILFVSGMRRYDRAIRFSTYLYKFTVLVDYAVTSVALSAPVSSTVIRNFLVEPGVEDFKVISFEQYKLFMVASACAAVIFVGVMVTLYPCSLFTHMQPNEVFDSCCTFIWTCFVFGFDILPYMANPSPVVNTTRGCCFGSRQIQFLYHTVRIGHPVLFLKSETISLVS